MSDKVHVERYLSTTALAKKIEKTPSELFQQLFEMGLLVKKDNTWELTADSQAKGGLYREHKKYGRYIVWPESIITKLDSTNEDKKQKLLTATAIGQIFEIPSRRMNLILSELGWIAKDIKGWQITELGKRFGGVQSKDKVFRNPYVRWPEVLVNNKILVTSVREAKGEVSPPSEDKALHVVPDNLEFREKFEAKQRATDGHYVRSKAEVIIDNWLYHSRIAHAYERRLPIEEDQYCDFFINVGKGVYIEYWGYESDPKYLSRKEEKRENYKNYGLQLIELTDKEVSNIDDVLPRRLLEFGIGIE
jgi:hypothetical protein